MKKGPILIIDDEKDIRDILKLILEEEGYYVITVSHGQEALDFLFTNPPQLPKLIFLDFMMPVLDGPGFVAALKQNAFFHHNEIPIVLISAFADASIPGVKKSISKPMEMSTLLELAAEYCS